MRHLINILTITIITCLSGQVKADFIDKLTRLKISELQNGYKFDSKTTVVENFSRPIDFNYSQSFVQIGITKKNKTDYFICVLIGKNDSILFGRVFKGDFFAVENVKKVKDIFNKPAILNLTQLHNEHYRTNLSPTDYFNLICKPIEIAFACGLGGNPKKEAVELKKYVKNTNKEKLNNWLRSPNIELQVYSVIGLITLRENGQPLTSEEDKLIDEVLSRNSKVYYCSGCVIAGPLWTAKELLNNNEGQLINYWMKR